MEDTSGVASPEAGRQNEPEHEIAHPIDPPLDALLGPPQDRSANTEPKEEKVTASLRWRDILAEETGREYFQKILVFIETERKSGKVIYPENENIFNALKLTELGDVKVVIIGQDPYHGPEQAHGLCFSVKPGVPSPPSLQNIFKELANDLGCAAPRRVSLEDWARQGVLLLNTVLTVEQGRPESHAKIGWQIFTNRVIKTVNDYRSGVVFILWGAHAQKKAELIDQSKHHIIKSAHPSPLSASRGFLGSKPFSKTNQLLASPIKWC